MPSLPQEDQVLLENMKGIRTYTIGGLTRRVKKLKRGKKPYEEQCSRTGATANIDEVRNSIGESYSDSANQTTSKSIDKLDLDGGSPIKKPRRARRREVKVGTNVFIPYNAVADSAIIGFETRTGASTSHTIGLLSTIVERIGGDKSKVNLSYSTAYRNRIATVKKYAEAIQEAWICLSPATIHWDDM